MAQDITSSITRTGLTGADPTVDKADMLNAVNDFITVINAILNGGQSFDQLNFQAATELTIATGAITVTQTYHTVDTQSDAASDDLDTITGTAGDVLYIQAAHTDRTVVIKHGTGNIITFDGADVSLDNTNKIAHLVRFGTSWYCLSIAVATTTLDAAAITYTPAVAADWNGDADPGDLDDALNQLADARTAIAILRDEKASGTAGGSSSATTWNNRDLNTEVYDNQNIVTIASNQFTPIAGEYKLYATATVGLSGGHRMRLYNVTGAASVREGLNNSATVSGSDRNTNTLNAIFTANGTDAYRIDHYTTSAQATTGLGIAITTGANEVYMEIVLEKIG